MAELNNTPTASQRFLTFGNQDLPAFVEKKDKHYVLFGQFNDYPYYLIDLYTRSAYHKTIIDQKVRYLTGNGWTYDARTATVQKQSMVNDFLTKNFGNETLNQASQKWANDLELFNGMAAEVIYNKGGSLSQINYIDFANVRSSPDKKKYYYTSRWYTLDGVGNRKMNKNPENEPDYKVFDAYDKEATNKKSQLYYFSVYHPNQQVYPLPTYSGAVIWINVDIALSDFHYHNIKNGFIPAHIINFYNGVPDEIKQEEIENRIIEKFTGEKGQRIILNFAMSKETGTDVQTLAMSDIDKQYIEVAKQSETKIFSAHFANPILFGIAREGALGMRTEIEIAHNEFNQMYIIPRQKLIEDMVNMFIGDFGIGVDLRLKTVQPLGFTLPNASQKTIDTIQALNSLPQAVAQKILDSMSASQILGLIGIESEATETTNIQAHFNSQANIDMFLRCGVSKADYTILKTESLKFTEELDFDKYESDFVSSYMNFAEEKISTKGGIEGDIIISQPTKSEIAKADIQQPELVVLYSYELSPESPPLAVGGVSREFCVKLMEAGKLYTRAEINNMSNEAGGSVWMMRGGWYTKPDTTIHVPHCRHEWQSNLVKKGSTRK